MNAKQKKTLLRIIISGVLFTILMILEKTHQFDGLTNYWILLPVYLVPYLIIGYDVLMKSIKNISHGEVFDENFLMMVATFGAFGIREFEEAVAVMLFYQVGELFQSVAVGKSRNAIKSMMDICPEYANIEENGELVQVDPDDVEVDSIIVIKPGERVPLDGIVVDGDSYLDTSALTGESVPTHIGVGEEIYSGCINGKGVLKVRTTKEFDDSTVSRILELVENASSKKAKVENFITKFAKYYTPAVTLGALVLAIIPPLIIGGGFLTWIERACTFLVVSCPCALVISVPMGFFGGIGAASTKGILVKGGNYLEIASELKTVVFDKTGTLTEGKFKVTQIIEGSISKKDILKYAAAVESLSTHPIAISIKQECEEMFPAESISDITEIAGHGLRAMVNGKTVLVGKEKLLLDNGINVNVNSLEGTVAYVAIDGEFAGAICIADAIKKDAAKAIADMKAVGIEKVVMLTGDNEVVAKSVAETLGIDEYHAGLLPADKVDWVEKLLSEGKKLAFAGDGINDAPVLTRADLGIAMGSLGSDAAIEASDIVLMDDEIGKIASIIRIAKKTLGIVKQNVVFALFIKFLVLILAAFNMTNMWVAVFADVGVAMLAILNSMRCLNVKNIQ